MTLLTRLAPGKADGLAVIHARCFDQGWSIEAFAGLLAEDTVRGYGLGDEAGSVAAFVVFRCLAGEADMLTLATDPAWQRRGLARRLVAGAVADLQALGIERMTLDVASDNAPALALYRTLGFEEDGRRRGYYRREGNKRVDGLLLSAPIDRITGLSPGATSCTSHDAD